MAAEKGTPKLAQYVQRYSEYGGTKTGFGRVHATRDRSFTVCGKLMENSWALLSDSTVLKYKAEDIGAARWCELCDEAVKNPSVIIDPNSKEGQELMGKSKSKTHKDKQKELLPMWDGHDSGVKYGSSSSHGLGKQAGFGYGNTCTHSGAAVACLMGRGITLAGAKGMDIDYDSADIVIDCAGATKKDFDSKSGSRVSGTQRLVDAVSGTLTHPDTLFIDWPDMQVPKVGYKFWIALLAAIPDKSRVVICCMGSHGRTGTAMACLIGANALSEKSKDAGLDVPDAVDIIRFVRKNHCSKAIETQGQEDYVARVIANFKSPGDKEELKRQWALNDAAFKKPTAVTVYTPQTGAASAGSPKSETKKETYTWVDAKSDDPKAEVAETSIGGEEDIMFLDIHENVVNESGEVVFEKGKLSAEEREWSKTLPTWGEYIAKRYEKGSVKA